MRDRLMALEESGRPIRVAIIGCGRFGSMMIAQIMRAPGMEVAVACDLSGQRAADAIRVAGFDEGTPANAGSVSEANDSITRRQPAVTDDSEVAIHADVDVVVEATGDPDVGAAARLDGDRGRKARRYGER